MKPNQKEIKIDSAPFMKSLLKKSHSLSFTIDNKIKETYTELEYYQRGILVCCFSIHGLLETLKLSRLFLGERYLSKNKCKSEITDSEYYRYHIETYFIRTTTFKDLILKLLNRVYCINGKEGNGLEDKVRKYAKLNALNQVILYVDKLDLLLSKIKPIRNNIAHGGFHLDNNLVMLQAKDISNSEKSKQIKDKDYYAVVRNLIVSNILEMYENEVEMASYLLSIYKYLYPQRRQYELNLKNSSKVVVPQWDAFMGDFVKKANA